MLTNRGAWKQNTPVIFLSVCHYTSVFVPYKKLQYFIPTYVKWLHLHYAYFTSPVKPRAKIVMAVLFWSQERKQVLRKAILSLLFCIAVRKVSRTAGVEESPNIVQVSDTG